MSRRGVSAVAVAGVAATCLVAVAAPVRAAAAAATVLGGDNPAAVLSRLTMAQRVGQLLMVGAPLPGGSAATTTAIRSYHAGSVILTGRSSAGVSAVRSLTNGLQALATTSATGGVPLFVATDQEGGYVQSLAGPGFSTIPTAVRQGQMAPATLRDDAARWGHQLASAGVNLDLAPVLDTVPASRTSTNQPIGVWDREYGTTPSVVTAAGKAFVQGMHAAGVETAVKHFPGLGRASGNTDTTYGVTDTSTTRYDAYIAPYAAATGSAGAGVVMVSLATYTRIDPHHKAVFSPTVLGGMLRTDLGFSGVIMTDAIDAVALRDLTPAQRAVRFVDAGGDLVLAGKPSEVPAVATALLAKANNDAAFRARVNASCLRILIAKQRAGLLAGGLATAANGTRLYVAEQTAAHGIDLHVRTSGVWAAPIVVAANAARAPAIAALPGTTGVAIAEVTPQATVAVRRYVPGTSSTWQSLGGSAASAPAIAVSPTGRIDVAVRGPDGVVCLREYRPGSGWAAWAGLGGMFTAAAPALVYLPSGDLDVFAVGMWQAVYRKVRHAGTWSGWVNVGGTAESGVAAAIDAAGRPVTFIDGGNASLWRKVIGLTGWARIVSSRPVGPPAAARTSTSTITVVVEGLDGRLRSAERTSSGWSAWSVLPFD